MSREEDFVKLRMPQHRDGNAGYSLRELKGPWTSSMLAMSQALRKMSSPEGVELLRVANGRKGEWDISRNLESVSWSERKASPDDGWVSVDRWEAASVAGVVQSRGGNSGAKCKPASDEGGWAWSAEAKCWLMPTFCMGGPGAVKSVGDSCKMNVRPVALTIWQWDREPMDDQWPSELSERDLLEMSGSMGREGLAMMLEGLSTMRQPSPEGLSKLRAMWEREEIGDGLLKAQEAWGSKRI